ncbi:MAG: hypothetical protein J6P49_02330, partial [Paludibacteraceae bacterium]|nr:hypothetical protein [Paludibacteraceae bacterium]
MEIRGNLACVSYDELVGGGIISGAYIRKLSSRGQIEQVQRACNGTVALYSVESLPMKYRAEVYRRYPDLVEKAESKPFVESVEPDGVAMQWFADYVLSDGRHLSTAKQGEFANNCAILNAFRLVIERA